MFDCEIKQFVVNNAYSEMYIFIDFSKLKYLSQKSDKNIE